MFVYKYLDPQICRRSRNTPSYLCMVPVDYYWQTLLRPPMVFHNKFQFRVPNPNEAQWYQYFLTNNIDSYFSTPFIIVIDSYISPQKTTFIHGIYPLVI